MVLTVFTCLSVAWLDLGYRGDEVIWSICCFCMNLAKSSDKKEGQLSVKMHLGVHTVRLGLEAHG